MICGSAPSSANVGAVVGSTLDVGFRIAPVFEGAGRGESRRAYQVYLPPAEIPLLEVIVGSLRSL